MKISTAGFLALALFLGYAGCSDDDNGEVTPPSEFEEVTITPKGGTFEFAAGFKVVVPAGAVEKDTAIKMRLVGSEELRPVYEHFGVSLDNLLAAVEGKPDGLSFKSPIKVIMAAKVEAGDFPVVHAIDIAAKTRTRLLTTVMADPDSDLVELDMHHFSPAHHVSKDEETKNGEKICQEEPCKCKQVKPTTKSKDVLCGTANMTKGCQVIDYQLKVEYPDCKTVHDERHITVSDDCVPEMTLTPTRSRICPNKDTSLTAKINLGCPSATLEGAEVKFTVDGPASVSPTEGVTNGDGETTTKLTAQDKEEPAKVTATSDIEYYTFFKYISFNGITELDPRNKKKPKHLEKETTVEIKPGQWTGSFTYNRKLIANCVTETSDHSGTFDITEDCDKGWVDGTAKVTQKVSVKATGCNASVQNINAPATLDLIADGDVDDYLHMELVLDLQYTPFYTYEICTDGNCSPPLALGGLLSFGYNAEDKTKIPLKDGTYKGDWALKDVEDLSGSYTITLQEKQAKQ